MNLVPIENTLLTLSETNSAMTYTIPDGTNWIVIQFEAVGSGSWTVGAVVTVEAANHPDAPFTNFASGALTYSSVGMKSIFGVTGLKKLRIRVSTPAAGTDQINAWVSAERIDG